MKLGIIGSGMVAQVFHAPAFARCEDVAITAVCDVHRPTAEKLAAQVGGATVYTDYADLLADPQVDTVSICTHTDTHAPIAVAAAQAGRHILLEKPMATDLPGVRAILEAVEENGVIFMLGMLNRFRTEARILHARRERGQMGEIYHAEARWMRRRGTPASWFTQKAQAGGGPALDIGVHAIDLAWYLMGRPKPHSVSGVAHHRLGRPRTLGTSFWGSANAGQNDPFDTEDSAVALVRFEGGKTMAVAVAWASNGPDEDLNLRLYGTKEGATLDPFLIYGEEEGYLADIAPGFQRQDAWQEAFAAEVAHFVQCVAEGRRPDSPAADGYAVQRIISGIYESSAGGREVML